MAGERRARRRILINREFYSSLSGLGTHLTMSLDNDIRFGPDVQWLTPPIEDGEDVPDFWEQNLAADEERMELAIQEVKKFLPGVVAEGFSPDCKSPMGRSYKRETC